MPRPPPRAARGGGRALPPAPRSAARSSPNSPVRSALRPARVVEYRICYRSYARLSPSFKFDLSIAFAFFGFRSHRTIARLHSAVPGCPLSAFAIAPLSHRTSLRCLMRHRMRGPGLCSIAFLHLCRFSCSFSARSRVASVLSSGIRIEHVRLNAGLLLPTLYLSLIHI